MAAVEECYKYAQLSAQKSMMFEEGMLEVYFLFCFFFYLSKYNNLIFINIFFFVLENKS